MSSDPQWIRGMPKHGDIVGNPNPGHSADPIWAAVITFPDGSEGLASVYSGTDQTPMTRVTLVTSDPKMLTMMKEMLAAVQPPPGGRIEWRTYRQSTEAVP